MIDDRWFCPRRPGQNLEIQASEGCLEVPVVGYPQRYSLRAHATEGRLGQPGTGHADATKNRVRASVTQVWPPPLDNPLLRFTAGVSRRREPIERAIVATADADVATHRLAGQSCCP